MWDPVKHAIEKTMEEQAAIYAAEEIQTWTSAVLMAIANGEIDIKALARKEMVSRGMDKDGIWVGFQRAKTEWEG